MKDVHKKVRKKKKENPNNLRLIIAFCIFVFFLFVGVSLFKIVNLVAKSTFDGVHSFVVAYVFPKNSVVMIANFSPDAKSISTLEVNNKQKAASHIGAELKIPIDAFVVFDNQEFNSPYPETYLTKMILRSTSFSTKLTIIDSMRLFMFSKTIPTYSIKTRKLDAEEARDGTNTFLIDKITSDLFTDYAITREALDIQIVNKADISGLGSRLARLTNNIGGDVIAVTTDRSTSELSEILYAGEQSYTVRRLSSILKIPARVAQDINQGRVADVVIVIGKDLGSTNVF